MNFKLISNINIFLYIIFCIQIYNILSEINLRYPHSLYLPNGNIFVIHEKGISIYDHLFTKQIEDVITFSENDEIKTNDLPRITTIFEDEYLFCIIKDKIYIFNDKGNLLFHNNTSILEDDKIIPRYYSLVVIKMEDNLYKYIILFIFNKNIYQIQYQFNIISNENLFISNYSIKGFGGNSSLWYDFNYALTCQNMIDKDKNNFVACFYLACDGMYYVKLTVGENRLNKEPSFNPKIANKITDIEYIKSVANYDRSKALISLYSSTGELKSFIFDINKGFFNYDIYFNQYLFNSFCKLSNFH